MTRQPGASSTLTRGGLSLERFEPTTGATVWSVPLPVGGRTLTQIVASVHWVGSSSLLVPGRSGSVLLDLRSGQTGPVPPGESVICAAATEVPLFGASQDTDGRPDNRHTFGHAVNSCSPTGASIPRRSAWPAGVGVTIGDIQVVTTTDGLQATTSRRGAAPVPRSATGSRPTEAADPDSDRPPAAPNTGGPATRAVAARWTATGFQPLTQPVVAGGVALLYADIGSSFSVVAVDPSSGKMRWSKPAGSGRRDPPPDLRVATAGDRVVYLRSDGDGDRIVVADAAGGRTLTVSSDSYQVSVPPYRCDQDVCLVVFNDDGYYLIRVEVLSGLIEPDRPYSQSWADPLGAGVVATTAAGVPRLVRPTRTGLLFDIPAAAVLAGGQSAVRGAVWQLGSTTVIEPVDAVSGTGDAPTVRKLGTRVGLVGLDAHTGRVRWRGPGTDLGCLPAAIRRLDLPVRCRWGSTAVATFTDGRWGSANASVALEGFDPVTGRTTWSTPLADGAGIAGPAPGGLVDSTHLRADGPAGSELVSLTDGVTAPIRGDPPVLCATVLRGPTGYLGKVQGGGSITEWATGSAWGWCAADGHPVTAARGWPAFAGAVTGTGSRSLRMVVTVAGLQGFHQP